MPENTYKLGSRERLAQLRNKYKQGNQAYVQSPESLSLPVPDVPTEQPDADISLKDKPETRQAKIRAKYQQRKLTPSPMVAPEFQEPIAPSPDISIGLPSSPTAVAPYKLPPSEPGMTLPTQIRITQGRQAPITAKIKSALAIPRALIETVAPITGLRPTRELLESKQEQLAPIAKTAFELTPHAPSVAGGALKTVELAFRPLTAPFKSYWIQVIKNKPLGYAAKKAWLPEVFGEERVPTGGEALSELTGLPLWMTSGPGMLVEDPTLPLLIAPEAVYKLANLTERSGVKLINYVKKTKTKLTPNNFDEILRKSGIIPGEAGMAAIPKKIPKELEPLAKEARKFKTAEEFVRGQKEVFHASPKKFKTFEPKSLGVAGEHGWFYFGEDVNWVKRFAKEEIKAKSSVKSFVLDMKTPLDVRKMTSGTFDDFRRFFKGKNIELSDDFWRATKQAEIDQGFAPGRMRLGFWQFARSDSGPLRQAILDAGYDGVIFKDFVRGKTNNTTRVVFSPSQIKTKAQLTEIFNQAKGVKALPTPAPLPEPAPFGKALTEMRRQQAIKAGPIATGKPRVSQVSFKQHGLTTEREAKLAEIMGAKKAMPAETNRDVQAIVDLMGEDDINRIINRKGFGVSRVERVALSKSVRTDLDEVARLTADLKNPILKAKAEKRMDFLRDRINLAAEKANFTSSKAGRDLRAIQIVGKETFSPEFWTYSARRMANRDLSTPMINRIQELTNARNSDELGYLMGQLQAGVTDEIALRNTLKNFQDDFGKTLTAITEGKTGNAIEDFKDMGVVLRETRGLPEGLKGELQQQIKTRKQIFRKRLQTKTAQMLALEKQTAELPRLLYRAKKNYGGNIAPKTREQLIKAFKDKDKGMIEDILGSLRAQSMASQILGIPRTAMSTLDMSMPFRQGVFLVGNPIDFAKSFKAMWGPGMSEQKYIAHLRSIRNDANYIYMKKAKVPFTNAVVGGEEQHISKLLERFPVAGRGVKFSNRNASAFLNEQRRLTFNRIFNKARKAGVDINDKKFLDSLGSFVGHATGRGSLGQMGKSMQDMGGVMFSARLQWSRINLINPVYYAKLHPFVRKEALKVGFKTLAMGLSVLTAATTMGASVEWNPYSADFLKIKVGSTRYDIWGGFQQYAVLLSRVWGGVIKSTSTGKEYVLGEGYKPKTKWDLITEFGERKTSPLVSFGITHFKGTDFKGDPISYGEEVMNRVTPMVMQDTLELIEEKGAAGLPMSFPAFFGVGVQTYEPRQRDPYKKLKTKPRKRSSQSRRRDSSSERLKRLRSKYRRGRR